jgi:hypothetical protein
MTAWILSLLACGPPAEPAEPATVRMAFDGAALRDVLSWGAAAAHAEVEAPQEMPSDPVFADANVPRVRLDDLMTALGACRGYDVAVTDGRLRVQEGTKPWFANPIVVRDEEDAVRVDCGNNVVHVIPNAELDPVQLRKTDDTLEPVAMDRLTADRFFAQGFEGAHLPVETGGFRLLGIRPSDPLHVAGLRNGDVVLGIDGVPLDLAGASAALHERRDATALTIDVRRRGRTEHLQIRVE